MGRRNIEGEKVEEERRGKRGKEEYKKEEEKERVGKMRGNSSHKARDKSHCCFLSYYPRSEASRVM